MAIPNEVIFGPGIDGAPTTYGQVREISDGTIRITLLHKRLTTFFLDQTQILSNGSAFPLTVMTCIGIETLGQIFVANENKTQSYRFVEIAKKMDQRFARKLSKKFKQDFHDLWPEKETQNIENFAELLYTFLRNTMIHGYQARCMFLSWEGTNNWIEKEGFIVLNPKWFWNCFETTFHKMMTEAEQGQENNYYRRNSLIYINKILA